MANQRPIYEPVKHFWICLRYRIETSRFSKSMDWFLYDRILRHESVNYAFNWFSKRSSSLPPLYFRRILSVSFYHCSGCLALSEGQLVLLVTSSGTTCISLMVSWSYLNQRLSGVNYFRKTLHLRYLTWFWRRPCILPFISWQRSFHGNF